MPLISGSSPTSRPTTTRHGAMRRGASVDREPSASGDRRNQDGAPCAPVTPLCGTADRDDARVSAATLRCVPRRNQRGEPAFDQVHPRPVGGREVHVEPRVLRQPPPDAGCLVRPVVVEDQVDVGRPGHARQWPPSTAETRSRPPARGGEHRPRLDVESREQRDRAMAPIVMSWEGYTPLGFAGERTAARAEFNHVRWISHCRWAWSSFQRRPDDEFETTSSSLCSRTSNSSAGRSSSRIRQTAALAPSKMLVDLLNVDLVFLQEVEHAGHRGDALRWRAGDRTVRLTQLGTEPPAANAPTMRTASSAPPVPAPWRRRCGACRRRAASRVEE